MVEAFGREISKSYHNQEISGVTVARNMPNIRHQQYADDTILPSKSTILEALGFKAIIKSYTDASRKKVNKNKLEIYFLNTKLEMENMICKIIGYRRGHFLCKYLGISLEKG